MTRLILALLAVASMAAPASGADSVAVQACKRAVQHWLFDDDPGFTGAQDLSNLKPPRARVRINNMMTPTVTCTFRAASKPLQLVEYCQLTGCHKAGNARFDEVSELLKREGY